jgi:hypothetical protein
MSSLASSGNGGNSNSDGACRSVNSWLFSPAAILDRTDH